MAFRGSQISTPGGFPLRSITSSAGSRGAEMPPFPVERIREDTPDEDLRRLIRKRWPFRNTRGTFRAQRLTPLDVARVSVHPDVRAILTADSVVALMMDEPDYVVWSGKAPLVWHSTIRKENVWVQSKLQIWPDRQTERRYNRLVGIVNELNERSP